MQSGVILAIVGCLFTFPTALLAQEVKPIRTLKHAGVRCLVFSPDGKTLATGGHDNHVRLWEVSTGKPVAALKRKGGIGGYTVKVVVFSSDGKALAWWDDNQALTLWNLSKAKEIKSILIDGENVVLGMTFAPDSQSLLTYGPDGTLRRWAVPSVKLTDLVKGKIRFQSVEDVDGPLFAFASDFKTFGREESNRWVKLYEVPSGKLVAKLQNDDPFAGFSRLAFAPGNKLLAVAEGYMSQNGFARIKLWQVGTDKVRILPGHNKKETADVLAFRPDGKVLASGGSDGIIKLWDVETGKELAALAAPGKGPGIKNLLFPPMDAPWPRAIAANWLLSGTSATCFRKKRPTRSQRRSI